MIDIGHGKPRKSPSLSSFSALEECVLGEISSGLAETGAGEFAAREPDQPEITVRGQGVTCYCGS